MTTIIVNKPSVDESNMNLLQAAIQHIVLEGEDAQIPHLDSCFVDNPWPVACHLGNIFLAVDEANMYNTIVR